MTITRDLWTITTLGDIKEKSSKIDIRAIIIIIAICKLKDKNVWINLTFHLNMMCLFIKSTLNASCFHGRTLTFGCYISRICPRLVKLTKCKACKVQGKRKKHLWLDDKLTYYQNICSLSTRFNCNKKYLVIVAHYHLF